jgi:hypothetical protein
MTRDATTVMTASVTAKLQKAQGHHARANRAAKVDPIMAPTKEEVNQYTSSGVGGLTWGRSTKYRKYLK